MKSTTKWYEDMVWLFQLFCLVLWPIGFLAGCMYGGLGRGFYDAVGVFAKVDKEWRRLRFREKTIDPVADAASMIHDVLSHGLIDDRTRAILIDALATLSPEAGS